MLSNIFRKLNNVPKRTNFKVLQIVSRRNYEIPAHLKEIGTATDPSFYKMVEYFYHFAVKVCEPTLLDYLKKHTHFSEKKRVQRVAGILKVRKYYFKKENNT